MITVNQIMSWHPCDEYPRSRVVELYAGRETLTTLEILALDIPAEDRLWVCLREDVIGARLCRLHACDSAERALGTVANPDPRSLDAVRVSRLYADGLATDTELAAASGAAYAASGAAYAAYAAAWAAAYAAAYAASGAAWAAAYAASGAAYTAAAWVAAWAAAYAASGAAYAASDAAYAAYAAARWAAEHQAQIDAMISLIEGESCSE